MRVADCDWAAIQPDIVQDDRSDGLRFSKMAAESSHSRTSIGFGPTGGHNTGNLTRPGPDFVPNLRRFAAAAAIDYALPDLGVSDEYRHWDVALVHLLFVDHAVCFGQRRHLSNPTAGQQRHSFIRDFRGTCDGGGNGSTCNRR